MSEINASRTGRQAGGQPETAPDDLRAALQEAVDALAGGLWDYGPGQDEHVRCNEVIARCRKALAAPAPVDQCTDQASCDDVLTRLDQRVLLAHGGKADGWKHHWNLTEADSLLHQEAAARIRKLEERLSAIPTPEDRRARFEKLGRSMDWDLVWVEKGYSDCNVDFAWTGYQAAHRDQIADAAQVLLDSWKGYVSVSEGAMLKPSRHLSDGTYALVEREAWDKLTNTREIK